MISIYHYFPSYMSLFRINCYVFVEFYNYIDIIKGSIYIKGEKNGKQRLFKL